MFFSLFLWSPIHHPPGVNLFTTQGGGDIDATWFCWLFFGFCFVVFWFVWETIQKESKPVLGPSDCVCFLFSLKGGNEGSNRAFK